MNCILCDKPFIKGQKIVKHPDGDMHLSCAEAENKRRDALDLEIAKQQELIDFEEAKTIYWKYVQLTHKFDKDFSIAVFQKYICDCIDKLLKNELLNDKGKPYIGICLSQPPQTGKSRCVTETLPSYFLGQKPFKNVIEVSYSDTFANKFGRRNLEKIKQFGKRLFNIEVSGTKGAAEEFEIEGTRGGMLSAGLNGQITGNPADLVIIDDPYKTMIEADSPAHKALVMDVWTSAIKMRVSATCKFIVVHTRWNEDDLIGYLLATEPDRWFEINFPMLAEDNEPNTGRKTGEPLLPEAGKDKAWVEEQKKSFLNDPLGGGTRAWNAGYQQRPSSKEGNMIKREYWQRYKLSLAMQRGEGLDEMLQSWDCSFKDTSTSDRVAGGVWGRRGANCYLMDCKYERLSITNTMAGINDYTRKYPKALAKLIEDKANGPAVIQMMKTKVPGLIPVKATQSKEERVNAVLPVWESKNVFIPSEIEVRPGVWQTCDWAEQVIDQCASFKPGKKVQADDLVDMCSQALNRMMYSITLAGKRPAPQGYYTDSELQDKGYKPYEIKQIKKTMPKPWERVK
jgi:predicted phage terminase large subunit-like protein